MDIINVCNQTLREYDCPMTTLAALAGISNGKLSMYLNEIQKVSPTDEIKLRTTIAGLRKLVAYANPLPLNFRNAGSLRRSMDAIENGTLKIVVYAEQTIAEQQ